MSPESKDLGETTLRIRQQLRSTTILIPAYGSPGGFSLLTKCNSRCDTCMQYASACGMSLCTTQPFVGSHINTFVTNTRGTTMTLGILRCFPPTLPSQVSQAMKTNNLKQLLCPEGVTPIIQGTSQSMLKPHGCFVEAYASLRTHKLSEAPAAKLQCPSRLTHPLFEPVERCVCREVSKTHDSMEHVRSTYGARTKHVRAASHGWCWG